jgi:hypothetical protein
VPPVFPAWLVGSIHVCLLSGERWIVSVALSAAARACQRASPLSSNPTFTKAPTRIAATLTRLSGRIQRGTLRSNSAAQNGSRTLSAIEALADLLPMNVVEEGVYILGGCSAEVHLIGVLVHVQDQQRIAGRQRLRVIA